MGEFITALIELAPILEALLDWLEKKRADGKQEQAIAELSQGWRYASETGDTSLLEAAIRSHIAPGGGLRDNVAPK